MGSTADRAKRLAETVKLPGSENVGNSLSNIIGDQLAGRPGVFTPAPSTLGNKATNSLTSLLDAGKGGLQAPTFSFVKPKKFQKKKLKLSGGEIARRDRFAGQLSQKARDAASARGLNRSEAGADIEARTLSRFYENLAAKDFEQERALNREAIDKENLMLDRESRLFNQQVQVEALRQGRSNELFKRQLEVIDKALQQTNIEFNQDQKEFATNLTAAGIPVKNAMEFMSLAQQGNIAGAEMVLKGIGLDLQAKNSLMGFVGDMFGGVGTKIIGSLL